MDRITWFVLKSVNGEFRASSTLWNWKGSSQVWKQALLTECLKFSLAEVFTLHISECFLVSILTPRPD